MTLEIPQRCTCPEHPNVNLAQKALLKIYGMIFLLSPPSTGSHLL